MNPVETLKRFVSRAFSESYGFVSWFAPGNDEIKSILQNKTNVTGINTMEIENQSGFIFAPFVPGIKNKTLLIRPDMVFRGYQEMANYSGGYRKEDIKLSDKKDDGYNPASKEEFLRAVSSIINKIGQGEAEKVVYSRTLVQEMDFETSHPAILLMEMHKRYPHAFCYLFFTPETGFWLGASPELLLEKKAKKYRTMALAGTREKSGEPKMNKNWPRKDVDEQAFVSKYIEDTLIDLQVSNYKRSDPYTFAAGNVEHLRSDFEFPVESLSGRMAEFIRVLHPTPAICGKPKAKALQLIREYEKYDRTYYCGFLGPLNIQDETHFFVNLRCMKLQKHAAILFVGGGITKDSEPEAEWNETKLKAETLLSVIREKY